MKAALIIKDVIRITKALGCNYTSPSMVSLRDEDDLKKWEDG